MKGCADDEGKDLSENFGRKAAYWREGGPMDFHGLQEICATELEGRYSFIKQSDL
jgi:hypothetical protein